MRWRYGADAPDPGPPEPDPGTVSMTDDGLIVVSYHLDQLPRRSRWDHLDEWLGMDHGLVFIIAGAVALIGFVCIALATW